MRLAVVAIATLGALPCDGAERSANTRAAFMRLHPCPATGATRGACPGYVVDHVHPLCAGGADATHNMQWQTSVDAKIKDREERRMCSRQR